jgi:hypothetical protein
LQIPKSQGVLQRPTFFTGDYVERIGFIGLGTVGGPMAASIRRRHVDVPVAQRVSCDLAPRLRAEMCPAC